MLFRSQNAPKVQHHEDFNSSYHVARALVDLKPRESELLSDDSFVLAHINERLNKNVQETMNNSLSAHATDNEYTYIPHIARALVDLKPQNSDFSSEDFNAFYLIEFNEQVNKYIKETQHDLNARSNLVPVGKVKIENRCLAVDPILAAYEHEEQFLTAINITLGSAPLDDLLAANKAEAEYCSENLFEHDNSVNDELIMGYPIDGGEFDALKELLIECDLLDEVLNDESGTLLHYMLEKTQSLERDDWDFDSLDEVIDLAHSMDMELEPEFAEEYDADGVWDAREVDELYLLENRSSEHILSDEINELLNIMTDEEIALLFPNSIKNTGRNEIAGRELSAIRADDYEGIDILSTQERIDLTKALLVALKEQVTEHGFVHWDIKPEHIVVDLGPPIGITILDYDRSMELPDGVMIGTEGYYAPERVTDPMDTNVKSDVYSMARVIALIWRVDLDTYIENEDYPYTPHLFVPEDTLFGIFKGIDDLSDDEKICIERTLTGMLETDPEQRFSIDEAIESFVILGAGEESLCWGEAADFDDLDLEHSLDHEELGNALQANNPGAEYDSGSLDSYGVWGTRVFDDLELLDEQPSEHVISDEMNELLNIMTDEEIALLFPNGIQNTGKAYFDVLQGIAVMPELEINLKNIAPEHVKKLLEFFESQKQSGIQSWEKGLSYAFEDGTEFTFKHDVFQRARKSSHDGVRYEAISNKDQLGEGGFGIVKRIKGTVSLDEAEEAIHFKTHGTGGKRRVVKVQHHSDDANPLAHYQSGFTFAKRAVHLAIKEPTVINTSRNSQTSYTVMNEISGRELFDIRAEDYEEIDVLSTQERIDLTKALLVALKEQVAEQGLVHRDIKPENIMVDLGPPIGVKIIDYDMSMEFPDGKMAGTEGYYAPELVTDPMNTSAKSDVYSMARVIALIWRVDLATYIENEDYPYTPHLFVPEDTLFGIFNGIDDLSDDEKIAIERTLTGMLATDPEQRFSLDEAIESFAFLGIEIEKEWNVDAILEWLAQVDTSTLPTTELLATLDLLHASNYSRDSNIVYNKAQITPLLRLIEEQSDTQIMCQTVRALFTVPFQWIEDNEVKFDPVKPTLFFQMEATERAEVLNEMMNKPEVKQILFEELFFPENLSTLEDLNGKKINELVFDQLFGENKCRGHSSSFFFRPKQSQSINLNDFEEHLWNSQRAFVEQ